VSRELLDRSSKRIETLLDRFGTFPPSTGARADAEELVRTISSLYGECLREIARALHERFGEAGTQALERSCADPLVASLLVAHGLHPVALEERVRRALESLGPTLRDNDADAQLLSVDEDAVTVRVDGAAEIVPMIEQAIFTAAPEVLEVRASGQTISLLNAI